MSFCPLTILFSPAEVSGPLICGPSPGYTSVFPSQLREFIMQNTGIQLHRIQICFEVTGLIAEDHIPIFGHQGRILARIAPLTVDERILAKWPHAPPQIRQALLEQIHDVKKFDFGSLTETPHQPNKAAANEILITDQNCKVTTQSERFIPHSILSKARGVEMCGEYSFEYKVLSEKDLADIAHCKKLLTDLPIALENSKRATEEAADEPVEQLNLSILGAMVMEQQRIRTEIKAQKEKLAHLESTIESRLILRRYHSRVVIPFDFFSLEQKEYHMARREAANQHLAVFLPKSKVV